MGMMCSDHQSCGLATVTSQLDSDLEDLFQPEQFCDSRTLWSLG